jgi:hypothetical protein
MQQVGFCDLPVELQVSILRDYDKCLWIASRSLYKKLRVAAYSEFMSNEMLYKPSVNEVKLLCKKFCIFKKLYCIHDKRTYYEGMTFYLMNNNGSSIKSIDSAGSVKEFGYKIFKEDRNFSKKIDIKNILFTPYPRPVWEDDTHKYDIDFDYITYLKIFINRGFSLKKSVELVIKMFDEDCKISEWSMYDSADMAVKLVGMHKLLGIKLDMWKNFVKYSDITYVGWTVPGNLDKHLNVVNTLAPTIRAHLLNYNPA